MRAYGSKKRRATKKSTASKEKKKRAREPKSKSAKKKALSSKQKPRQRTAPKKPVKRKGATKTHRGKKALPKRPTKAKRLTKAQLREQLARAQAERERVERRLAKLEADRQRQRRKRPPKGKQKPKGLRRRKRQIEKERTERKLATEKLPRKTRRQKEKSRRIMFERIRGRFAELLEEARRLKQTPKVDYRRRKMDSRTNKGEQRIIKIEDQLREDNVEEILWQVEQAARSIASHLPNWLGVLAFAGMGERLIGYGNRVLSSKDPDAGSFQTQGIESTGIQRTREGMLRALRDILEEYAGEQRTVVHLYYVKIQTFARLVAR